MKKRIVLCADDYGQALPISEGILELVEMGRLTAVSCMVNSPEWPAHAQALRTKRAAIDVGLHFNLTLGLPLSSQYIQNLGRELLPISQVLKRAWSRQFSQSDIEAECHAQLDAFEQAMGELPDYIDGHQHVHQFPVIRSALVAVYEQRLREKPTYIRLVNESIFPFKMRHSLKKAIIHATGTRQCQRLLDQQTIPHNTSFAGIYPFEEASDAVYYRELFIGFLQTITDQGMIMCHPGLANPDGGEVIAKARLAEYTYLRSPAFLADCEQHGVVLSRLLYSR